MAFFLIEQKKKTCYDGGSVSKSTAARRVLWHVDRSPELVKDYNNFSYLSQTIEEFVEWKPVFLIESDTNV